MTESKPRKTSAKARATRQKLFDAAVRLFARDGFDKTTMRAIADEAGLATGATYYYFRSKDDVVMALYDETLHDDERVIAELMAAHPDASARLTAYVEWKLNRLEPYHQAFGALIGRILTPHAGLSPFGERQKAMRARDQANMATLMAGDPAAQVEHAPLMARALWGAWMAVVLYWLHDDDEAKRSAGAAQRFALLAQMILHLPAGMWGGIAPVWEGFFGDAPMS